MNDLPIPLSAVLEALADFHQRFPRPGIDALELSEPYFVETDWAIKGKSVPHSYHAGVYFLFNRDEALLYIGKSDGLGARVGGRFMWNAYKTAGVVKDPSHRGAGVVSVRAIAFLDEHWFESAAVEAYLIDALKPPLNRVGTNRF